MKHLLIFSLLVPICLAHADADAKKDAPAIIAEASKILITALTEAIADSGSVGAISVCSEKAPEIAAAVGNKHNVSLRRVTEKPRRPTNAASKSELEILSAFAADMENGKPPAPRTITNHDSITFVAPIVIPGPLCLQCHGDPTDDISPETLAAIRKLYPNDKATGYKTGDLRGAWAVLFDSQQQE